MTTETIRIPRDPYKEDNRLKNLFVDIQNQFETPEPTRPIRAVASINPSPAAPADVSPVCIENSANDTAPDASPVLYENINKKVAPDISPVCNENSTNNVTPGASPAQDEIFLCPFLKAAWDPITRYSFQNNSNLCYKKKKNLCKCMYSNRNRFSLPGFSNAFQKFGKAMGEKNFLGALQKILVVWISFAEF